MSIKSCLHLCMWQLTNWQLIAYGIVTCANRLTLLWHGGHPVIIIETRECLLVAQFSDPGISLCLCFVSWSWSCACVMPKCPIDKRRRGISITHSTKSLDSRKLIENRIYRAISSRLLMELGVNEIDRLLLLLLPGISVAFNYFRKTFPSTTKKAKN